MKKYYIFILIVFSFCRVFGQTPNTYSKVKYYLGDSLSNPFYVKSIVKLDSGYLLGIQGNYELFIVRIDHNGEKLSMYHGSHPKKDFVLYYGKTLLTDKDNNIIVCHNHTLLDSKGLIIGNVLKLSETFDTIWNTTLTYPDTAAGCTGNEPYLILTAMHETLDGGYILTGKYYYNCIRAPESVRTFLIKLDSNGNEEWRRMYMDKSYSFSIDVTDDGGYVFPDFKSHWRITKTDSLGNELWATQPSSSVIYQASDLICKDNYVVAVAPYMYNNAVDPYDYLYGLEIVKLDQATGQVIWNKQYRTFEDIFSVTLHRDLEIVLTGNEDIVIAATDYPFSVNGQYYDARGILFKLNSQGDSLWCRFYDVRRDEDMSQFNDVVVTDDGGFLAGGFVFPYDHSYWPGALLVKTDSMGMAPNAITLDIGEYLQKQQGGLEVYPNPAENIITFDIGKLKSLTGGLLSIYDAKGEQLRQIKLNSDVNRLNIKELSPGVYFYQLQHKNETLSGKFIKTN
ncbi:MAG: T9SS type A sorting domain-containing protein [Bacteroidales bacterium]|nr:T9SS type A sorting domain-containing protein [Bacteroidales bacterium]